MNPTESIAPDDDDQDMPSEALASLLTSLADRLQNGEPIDLESECANAKHASDLRHLWGMVLVTEAMAGVKVRMRNITISLIPVHGE